MSDGLVDLRSDTVTRPDAAMRAAMAEAVVGDDVYGEDPTVRELEETAAGTFGVEAGALMASGVMANLVALLTLARRGTEVLVEADAHVVNYEGGAGAMFAGVQFRTVAATDGLLRAEQIRDNVREDHFPLTPTSLVCVEQTHNRRGGTAYEPGHLAAVKDAAAAAGLPVFVDGARVFNACVATGSTPASQASGAAGLTFCLSKGLGAPVGSVLVGPADTIAEAKGWRRRVGGAMRQSGVIAAAGLVALRDGPQRLEQDHLHAARLADAARDAIGDPARVPVPQTNIVYVEQVEAAVVTASLRARGVLSSAMDARTLRLVTHRDVAAADVDRAATALKEVLST